MSIHLTIENENRGSSCETIYDLFCGWKQGLGWDEKVNEKRPVKQT